MFENIVSILNGNYRQGGFSLGSLIATAQNRANAHIVIQKALQEVNEQKLDIDNFSRYDLVDAYKKTNFSSSTVVLLTFWWGGMSHNNQAPIFYTQENLDKLNNFAHTLFQELKALYKAGNLEEYRDQLHIIYNKLKIAEYKLAGIDTAFLTKVLQFSCEAYNVKSDKYPFPIIADKWSKKAVYADLIALNKHQIKNGIFRDTLSNVLEPKFRGTAPTEFDKYWMFMEYFYRRVQELRNDYKVNVTPFDLESIIFGWAKDMANPENPRVIAHNIITSYIATN
jgi:hypothetical protein